MARPASEHPTDGELEILAALWEYKSATLGQVCQALRADRDVATTTVATMLGVMLDKGLVRRRKGNRGNLWSAAVTHDAAARGMVGKLVDGVFAGSAGRLVSHLVEGGRLTESELVELRQLIDDNTHKTARAGAKAQKPQQ